MNDEPIKCPGCDLQLPAGDLQAQVSHLETEHPEIIRGRLIDAGFERTADGKWIDTLAGSDVFTTANLDVALERPDAGGTWSTHGEAQDFAVDVAPSTRWGALTRWPPIDKALRNAGYEVHFTTPDHRGDPTLRIYERYTGLRGQERIGLVDELGTVWHYDSFFVSWVAELPGERWLPLGRESKPHIAVDLRRWAS